MKTATTKKNVSVSHSNLGQAASTGSVTVTDPVPTEKAPSPPGTYVPTKLGKGFRPQRAQIAIAPKMASELRGRADYDTLFGAGVPEASTVADALEIANGWTGSLQNAAAWFQYAKQQEKLAWKHALGLTDTLRVPFDFRTSRDATVAETLPSTAKFFGAKKDSAKKGAATKKAEKKKAASAGAAEPASPAVNSVVAKSVN